MRNTFYSIKMAVLRVIMAILALSGRAHSFAIQTRALGDMFLSLEPQLIGGFNLVLSRFDERETIGHIGRTLFGNFNFENIDGGVNVMVGNVNLTINTFVDDDSDNYGVGISWKADTNTRLEDCIDFGNKQWYGGPMQWYQNFAVQTASLNYVAAVTSESDHASIVERYWVNSAGEYIYVHPEVPLFVDHNNILPNHICFGAQIAPPYSNRRTHTDLSYNIWFHENVRKAQEHAVATYLGHPSGLPDYRMVEHPIWCTWAQFSRDIDETNLLEYAYDIIDNGFNNSQFEIDDLWEVCYGSLTVDTNKFPDFGQLVASLKELGFRVSIWVHPFINRDCDPWYTYALENGYLVMNEEGSPDTTWWNNNGSVPGYIDFTNPEAATWWSDRVRDLIDTYGIESIKFDAGESSWSPQIPVQNGDIDLHPHNIVESYLRVCSEFGNMIEVRTGFRTQDLPVFVRMVDRDSVWGLNNGLSTVITSTLQMNLNGYTFVLPDMIGGNGYGEQPSKELFIRWVQATTFLPTMQYSFVPWNYDNQTVEICKKYTELHAAHAQDIYNAMNASVTSGSLVNAPVLWADPTDTEMFEIDDQYLLGDNILVAPVLEEGATSRDIYLPSGIWYAEGDTNRTFEGPQWLRDYPAPLDSLPYFIREATSVPDSADTSQITISMILLCIIIKFLL